MKSLSNNIAIFFTCIICCTACSKEEDNPTPNYSEEMCEKFSIRPNTAQDLMVLSISEEQDLLSLKIYNSLNELQFETTFKSLLINSKISIDIQPLSDGIYFLKVENTQGECTLRFVKQN